MISCLMQPTPPYIIRRTADFASGRASFLIAAAMLVLLPVVAAWIQLLHSGLPYIPPVPQVYPNNFAGSSHSLCHVVDPEIFYLDPVFDFVPAHWLSILVDHPRLYFNSGCALHRVNRFA